MSLEQLVGLISQYGYVAIVALLALGILGLPVPDETLLTLIGFLIFRGTLFPLPAYLSAFLGTSVGITLSYCLGRYGGLRLIHRFGPRLHISHDRLEWVRGWFERNGRWALTAGYFVPGVRHLIAILAGSTGWAYARFAVFAYLGAGIWCVLFITAGVLLGKGWERFPGVARTAALVIVAIIVLFAGVYFLFRRFRRRSHPPS